MGPLRTWWSAPDQFDTITSFLSERGLRGAARHLMATIVGSSLLVVATTAACQRPLLSLSTLLLAVIGLFVAAMTWFWCTHWPTAAQSRCAITAGAIGTTAVIFTQSDPVLGAQCCVALAITGAYVAFFHTARLLAINIALAMLAATITTLRLSHVRDIPTAMAMFWLIAFCNLALPVVIGAVVHAMSTYARQARIDTLTGLLNRRGFLQSLAFQLTRTPAATHPYLIVLVLDLDAFKSLNDTHGHTTGDQALATVAEVLRRHTPAQAVIARTGGEEFVIAVTAMTPNPSAIATRLCIAIAALSYGITASIGTTSAARTALSDLTTTLALLTTADTAMYTAKHRGGNQTHHDNHPSTTRDGI